MRLLILAAATTLVITSGTAMAVESHAKGAKHHHYHDATAAVPAGSAPADILSAHEAHIKNLGDSGYNPSGDLDAHGNVKAN